MSTASEVAKRLLQIKAIRLSPQSPFTWASGIQSPIYCDNRMILSYPDIRDFVKSKLAEKSAEFGGFDMVAGVATAGIAHGILLADALGLPFIYVRSKAKGHGRQNLIEGDASVGQKVLVVEDLISTGGSSIKAVDALREAELTIVGVLAIFSYGFEKAVKAFEHANCPYKTLSNYEALIKEAIENRYISDSDYETLFTWREKIGA